MPPLPVVPNVCKLIIGGLYGTDASWLNILHVGYSGSPPNAGNILSYLETVDSDINGAYSGEMNESVSVTNYEMIDLSSDTGASNVLSVSHAGTRTGDYFAASAAMVISGEISRRYRGGHPRTYAPFGDPGVLNSGASRTFDSAFVASVQSAWDTLMGQLSDQSFGETEWNKMVNVSYYTAHALRVTPVVDNINSWTARARVCSQRRRLGKVGG